MEHLPADIIGLIANQLSFRDVGNMGKHVDNGKNILKVFINCLPPFICLLPKIIKNYPNMQIIMH